MKKQVAFAVVLVCSVAVGEVATRWAARSRSAIDVGRTVRLAPRTKTSGCRLGANPDRACSPGAYYSKLTKPIICSAGFHTGDVGNVPHSEKFTVEQEYGLAPRYYGRTLEIDHIVALELGGSNDIANLFPRRDPPADGPDPIGANWRRLYKQVFGVAPAG